MEEDVLPDIKRTDANVNNICLTISTNGAHSTSDVEVNSFVQQVLDAKSVGERKKDIIDKIFDDSITDTQTKFYPFVAMLFRVMGLDCQASRPGDNGARCPVGAIFKADNKMKVSAPESDDYIALPINYENLVKHKYFVQEVDKTYWNHQFQKESDRIMEEIYEKFL